MQYTASVPFEVAGSLSQSDPDVRSLDRLPSFVGIEPVSGAANRYQVRFQIEAGSLRGAADILDELSLEVQNALGAYHPRLLEPVIG